MQKKSARVSREMKHELRQFVYDIVSRVVDHPADVHINVVPSTFSMLAELHTHPDDVGQVVGRGGSVVQAIRTILAAYGGKTRVKVELSFVTERENEMARHPGAAVSP